MTLYGTHGTMTVWDGERFMLRIPYVILTQGDTKFFICLAGELALRNYLGVYYLNGVKMDERVPYQNSFGWCVTRSLLISSVHTARYYDMDYTTWERPDGGEGEELPPLTSSDEAIEQDVSMVSFLRQLLRAPDPSQVDTLLNDSNVNSRAEALSAIWSSQPIQENHFHVRSSGPHLMSPVNLTGEVQMESRLQEPSVRRGVALERTGMGAWDNRYENGCSFDNCPWCERLGCHGVNCSDYTCDTCDKIEPCEFDCGRCVQCQRSYGNGNVDWATEGGCEGEFCTDGTCHQCRNPDSYASDPERDYWEEYPPDPDFDDESQHQQESEDDEECDEEEDE